MTPCIALDDFLRALARTPRRSCGSQRAEASLGNALESDGFSAKAVEASDTSLDCQPRLERIPAGAVCADAGGKAGEEHQAVSKRKPAAQSLPRQELCVGNKPKRVVVSGDSQAQLPLGRRPRRKIRDGQAPPSRIRKGVVRKRRVPVNELVLVNRIADFEPIQGEPVDSDAAYDLIDDPICGSEEFFISVGHPHKRRKPLSAQSRNITKSQREPLPCIDLSEFRMPTTPAGKICGVRRGGSGFDGVVNAKVLPGGKVRKKESGKGRAAMGELNLVTSGELCLWQADPRQALTAARDRLTEPRSLFRQPRLQGVDKASRPLATVDANIDPAMSSSPPLRKSQRRVSFAWDLFSNSPPIIRRDSPEKGAVVSNGKRDISSGMRRHFSPVITKSRRTFDQEIYEQFARVTAPARKIESEFGDTDGSSEGSSSEDEGYQGNDMVDNESECSGEGNGEGSEEDREEEGEENMLLRTDLSMGSVVSGIGITPTGSLSLGDPNSQNNKPVGASLGASNGPPNHLAQGPWRVPRVVHRNTPIEVQDEILDDAPRSEVAWFPRLSNISKRRKASSLPLLSFRQREEEMESVRGFGNGDSGPAKAVRNYERKASEIYLEKSGSFQL